MLSKGECKTDVANGPEYITRMNQCFIYKNFSKNKKQDVNFKVNSQPVFILRMKQIKVAYI